MKTFNPDKEQSEKNLSLPDFLKFYNEGLPPAFPRASISSLREFRKTYPKLFNAENEWSLAQHRKKFMDWLPQRMKSLLR